MVDPFPPLTLLATDIYHQHLTFPELESCLGDADCPRTGAHNVLLCGDVLWSK